MVIREKDMKGKTKISTIQELREQESRLQLLKYITIIALILSVVTAEPKNFLYFMVLLMFAYVARNLVAMIFREKSVLMENELQEVKFFAGKIDDLTTSLYLEGLRLHSKVGKYYIFRPDYYLFRKTDILVFKESNGYQIQSTKSCLSRLRFLSCKGEIENQECRNNRKQNGYGSNSEMIPGIRNNKKRG